MASDQAERRRIILGLLAWRIEAPGSEIKLAALEGSVISFYAVGLSTVSGLPADLQHRRAALLDLMERDDH